MAAVLGNAPPSVAARILPGWMSKEEAIRYLTRECVDPQFNPEQATVVWEEYRRRIEESPAREAIAPPRLALTAEERTQADAFLRGHRQSGAVNILDVIKIDP